MLKVAEPIQALLLTCARGFIILEVIIGAAGSGERSRFFFFLLQFH
jgi:hypothetical protein